MIKLLLIEPSNLLRKAISLAFSKELNVIEAKDEYSARSKLKENPDVVLMNIHLPFGSAFDLMKEIVDKYAIPVVVMSNETNLASKDTITALVNYGAVDVISQPGILSIQRQKKSLIEFIKIVDDANVKTIRHHQKPKEKLESEHKKSDLIDVRKKILVIGASSGGPPVVEKILRTLPKNFPIPVIIVQHLPKYFTKTFANRLNKHCKLEVKEAKKGEEVKRGKVLIAPGGYNIELQKRSGKVIIVKSNQNSMIVPSVDVLLASAAELYQDKVIGVILTGMGSDGCLGMEKIKKNGGKVIAQDEHSCAIYGMPKVVIEAGHADYILPADKIVKKVISLLKK